MGISEIHAGWFFVVLLLTAIVESTSDCLTQRCLATNLVNLINNRLVQPSEDCKIDVFLKEIVFETLEMNTQTLQLSSILKIQMVWVDPYLSWDSTYPYDQIVLPVSNVWTPSLSVKNALRVDKQPASSDLLVFRNGTVSYKLLMWITVGCDLNLYLYPFAKDKCLIALDGWNELQCGERVTFGQIMLAGKSRGDWQVESVIKEDLRDTVLMVCMSSKSINVLMTLIVPSLLIMLADIMCFFLPLGGEGERISFRVTLVLSFVMFLLILSGILPGNRQCTPLIQYHFSVCLIFLVMSMIETMLVMRLAVDGCLIPFSIVGCCKFRHKHTKNSKAHQEIEGMVPELLRTVTLQDAEVRSLQRIVKYLDDKVEEEQDTQKNERFADMVDKCYLLAYLCSFLIYIIIMAILFNKKPCDIDHMDF
ncbi:5-hydroxytryptamine receptor 3A isoform X2 [Amia ocellicauda]|uniref:5-hydroxytryptamine receptor 3A isoform X2 n=1 Tax=Amia ocellicauda TaxID=2972642 RepID=UPI003464AE25